MKNKTQHNREIDTDDKQYFLEKISLDLNKNIIKNCGEFFQKGIFPTDMNRGIRVYVRSRDEHLPIHFHVSSSQRYLDARFTVQPLQLMENNTFLSKKQAERDVNYIIKYFSNNPDLLEKIKKKFIELNPNLDYLNKKEI